MTMYPYEGAPLSNREWEVLTGLTEGLTDKEIAAGIHVSFHTIKSYMKTLLVKLGARNRTHAVALAYHRGLLVVPRRAA